MRHALAHAWRIVAAAGQLWLARNAFIHAGALSFYALFSLAPVAIIAVSIVGAVFGDDAARGIVAARLRDIVGAEAALAAQDVVARSRPEVAGLIPTVMGVGALLLGATTVFAQMQASLNRFWGVAARPQKSAIASFVKTRLVSLTVVAALGGILLASLVGHVAVGWLVAYAEGWGPLAPLPLRVLETALSVVAFTVLFAVVFKVLPDAEVAWQDVRAGAFATALLFTLGQSSIAAYLVATATASAYGAAGSLVLLLLWVYYSALIVYFGAALTKAHALAAGRPVVPRPTAVLVREELIVDEA
jgi:membrane protein